MTYNNNERHYDIDWLRTLAFGVLILYHVGMYYVTDWGWHIKSEETSTILQDIMILTNPWRMSLLFFIGGIALALVQPRYSSWYLAKSRTTRLLIPLLFGMFVIVVPQIYYEALSQSLIKPGYLNFWSSYINPNTELLRDHHTIIGLLTWNHLWFLPYLWVYSLIFILLKAPLNSLTNSKLLKKIPATLALSMAVLALTFVWLMLRQDYPPTNALINDWYNHGKYLLVFTLGYFFVLQKHWWRFVIEKRLTLLVVAILAYGFIIADRHDSFTALASQFETNLLVKLFYGIILSINHWAWLFCVVGFAGFYLNRPSPKLSYATNAILPWYILHQTLIIVFAWWLKPLLLNPLLEAILLLSMTIMGCLIGYEVIRRVNILRLLCGMKTVKRKYSMQLRLQS